MGKILIPGSSGGGVSSDDVTAKREHVLQGYTALTSDSNDESVQGTIPNRGNGTNVLELVNSAGESRIYARMDEGYYSKNGQWKPAIAIPYAVLSQSIGVDAGKMLDTLSLAGVRGAIPVRGYKGPDSPEFSYYPHEGGYLTRVEEGYYHKGGGYKPYVIVPTSMVKNAVGYRSEKTLSDTVTCGEQGQIPIWSATHGDVVLANASHSGQGFAYDLPGVGRGIVVGIKNGSYIQGANYVFFPLPNLLSHNLRAGENFAGITGTMPDYSSGRTVFNGATFDGLLVSGVAAKGFYANGTYYAYNIESGYAYGGIYGGGMNLQLTTDSPALRSRRIGCVFSQSINVTPFRQIVVYYRSAANIQGAPYVTLEAHVSRASVRGQVNVSGAIVDTIDVIRKDTASPAINREGQIVLDVSAINEYVFLSFGAFCNQDRASDIFAGAVQITRVDFLN
nr:MAG TPA: hypothetical protein [Caudoviricetes sp.]